MFSRSKKKSNLNENLPLSPDRNSKIIDPKHQNFDPVDPTSYEPSVKKKMKVSNNSYTV